MDGYPTTGLEKFDGVDDIPPYLIVNMQSINEYHVEELGVFEEKVITVFLMCSPVLRVHTNLVDHGNSVEAYISLAPNFQVVSIQFLGAEQIDQGDSVEVDF
jgi:hypothetical protein